MTSDAYSEPSSSFNVEHQPRTVAAWSLTDNEIDNLATLSLFGNMCLAFLSAFIGAALSFALTVVNTDGGDYANAVLGVLVVAAVPCGIGVGMSIWNNGRIRERIKKRHGGDAG